MADYPQCHLVNDRPVMIVRTPDGGADCVVLDWVSGSFVPDRSYFSRTLPGDFKDVDSVTPEQMAAIVARLRADIVQRMASQLAGAPPEAVDASAPDLLGLAPDVPPFDADDMAPLSGPGLLVLAPKLVVRHHLDAVLGTPEVAPAPVDTIAAVYTVGDGVVLAVFPTDEPTASAVLLQIGRAPA